MQGTSRSAIGPVRMFHVDETVAVAETGAICVALWRGAVTKVPFEWQRSSLAEVVQRHPRGAGFLCVIEPTAKPPDDELRKASTQMVLSHGERLSCVACVIEGEGFRAAVTRGALSGMVLLLRNRKSRISFFSKIPEAARWMSGMLPMESADAFTAIVEHIRSRFPT
jgi:hypothetical protein